jgi:hypothetical protein
MDLGLVFHVAAVAGYVRSAAEVIVSVTRCAGRAVRQRRGFVIEDHPSRSGVVEARPGMALVARGGCGSTHIGIAMACFAYGKVLFSSYAVLSR